MKLLLLIGALLLSTAPVQASNKTFDEIMKGCEISEEAFETCISMMRYSNARAGFTVLCKLRQASEIAPEVFEERVQKAGRDLELEIEKLAWNEGVKDVLKAFPLCPLKPIP
jgi:hypothetical protein